MQRFLSIYTAIIMLLSTASGLSASENRYGQPMTEILPGGAWWHTKTVLTPDDLASHEGAFVVVKGRVKSTFRTREDLYLNFGENYKTDFTVRIPKRAWKAFGDMEGKEIVVRGIVREYNGPIIVVDRREQIYVE